MRIPRIPVALVAAFVAVEIFCHAARADTILLKNGDKLEGKVTAETDSEVTIEYHVSAAILDSRTVKKDEVLKVEKESPEEAAYGVLKNYKAGTTLLSAAPLEQMVNAIHAFLVEYPDSKHSGELKQNLELIEAAAKRLAAGEIELNGRWLGKDEIQKERVQLTGLALYDAMQEQEKRGDRIGALNSFAEIEKSAAGSRVWPDAIELAEKILPSLHRSSEQMLQTFKIRKAERDQAMLLLSGADKVQTMAAGQREEKQIEATVEAASKAGLAWPPLVANEKALSGIEAKATDEQKRLAAIPTPPMHRSIALATEAQAALARADFPAAAASLKQALALWSTNEMATRLTADLSAAQAQAAAAPPATPAPEKPKTTPAPAATPRPAATPAAAPAPAPGPEKKENFLFSPAAIIVAIVAVILALIGVTAYRQMRAKASVPLE